jgi:hypothetical protein
LVDAVTLDHLSVLCDQASLALEQLRAFYTCKLAKPREFMLIYESIVKEEGKMMIEIWSLGPHHPHTKERAEGKFAAERQRQHFFEPPRHGGGGTVLLQQMHRFCRLRRVV